jgi:hypothetical protein
MGPPVYQGVTNLSTNFGMRYLRRCAVGAFALVALLGSLRAQSRSATLEAIHCLENPTDSTAPGRCGELGPYQFREATWHKYSQAPFAYALNRRASDKVAIRHYEWLKEQIESRGIPASSYNIALAWNGGLGAVLRDRCPQAARDYAQRASNLASSFDRTTASQ